MKKLLLLIILFTTLMGTRAQVGKTLSILINVKANTDGTVTLSWPAQTFTGTWKIYKRKTATDPWSASLATLTNVTASWTDATFKSGDAYEYLIYQMNATNQAIAEGYIYAGNKRAEIPSFGSIILLIDSNYIKPLAAELKTLNTDLVKNGWIVNTIYAGRKQSVPSVKAKITSVYNGASIKPRSLYIIGHVPVPYSGAFRALDSPFFCAYPPDGHVEGSGNHTGAWPADAYYADFTGAYDDITATVKTGGDTRNWNVPGDGKFDECKIAGNVDLEIGRVDLYNMPIFNKSDTLMVKNYLNRAHLWRKDSITTVERGLVDDNFTGLSLSHSGWLTQSSMVPRDSIFDTRDYFTAQNKSPYLWSAGCGAGSYTTCSGIGAMNNWNPGIFNNIFTSLSGSFFGDWDAQNDFLRGPIASGSLACFWGGIPTWFNHYMGLGFPIGHGAKYTQNSKIQDFNGSENGVYIALMGDPTSRVRNVPPTGNLKVSVVAGKIVLNWGKAKGKFDGYAIYRVDSVTNTWTRVNAAIITDTFYTDLSNFTTGKYKYAVRSIRFETNVSGTWYNLGAGAFGWINYTNTTLHFSPLQVKIYPNPSSGIITISTDNPGNEMMSVSVFDLAGKTIFETKMQPISGVVNISLPANTMGCYMVQCTQGEKTGVSKILISK